MSTVDGFCGRHRGGIFSQQIPQSRGGSICCVWKAGWIRTRVRAVGPRRDKTGSNLMASATMISQVRPSAEGADVNGDGFPDLLIGAAQSDANGTNSAQAYVVLWRYTRRPPHLRRSTQRHLYRSQTADRVTATTSIGNVDKEDVQNASPGGLGFQLQESFDVNEPRHCAREPSVLRHSSGCKQGRSLRDGNGHVVEYRVHQCERRGHGFGHRSPG
jgi:hypothetical protein